MMYLLVPTSSNYILLQTNYTCLYIDIDTLGLCLNVIDTLSSLLCLIRITFNLQQEAILSGDMHITTLL